MTKMESHIGPGGKNKLLEEIAAEIFPFYHAMLQADVQTETILGVFSSFLMSAAAERDVPIDYMRMQLVAMADRYETYSVINKRMRLSGKPVNTEQ